MNIASETSRKLEELEKLEDNGFDAREFAFICLARWTWFILSLIVMFIGAWLYLKRTTPYYSASALVQIKEERQGKSALNDITSSFQGMGLLQSSTLVENELYAMKSPAVMREVVTRMKLNISYETKGFFRSFPLYGPNQPIMVDFQTLSEDEFASFEIQFKDLKTFSLTQFSVGKAKSEEVIDGKLGEVLNTPAGRLVVLSNPAFKLDDEEEIDPNAKFPNIQVYHSAIDPVCDRFGGGLNVEMADKNSTVIRMAFNDVSPLRAQNILEAVIDVYNEQWIKDKNVVSVSTSEFITKRLEVIEKELSEVDENISSYKSANLMPDIRAIAQANMAKQTSAENAILQTNNQLEITKFLRSYMTDHANQDKLLPANSGVDNSSIESLIGQYNTLLLSKKAMLENAGPTNPAVVTVTQQLNEYRQAILSTIDNQIVLLNTQLRAQDQVESKASRKIAANPEQAKFLLSVERKQAVKEALYLFLLQKREENELSQAFTAYNNRVVSAPMAGKFPTSPNRQRVYLVAIALGFAVPIGLIYLLQMMNTTVRGRKDTEMLTLPYLGEIPYAGKYFRKSILPWVRKRQQAEDKDRSGVVVKDRSRNVINEAFRVVRANIEFILGSDKRNQVLMYTSMNAGTGKTFLCYNVGLSFAIKKKRVILLDLDIRKASLSKFVNSPAKGMSDFLNGTASFDDIVVHVEGQPNLDVAPVGTIPPNPSELLYENRLAELIDRLRKEYDIIFIDCPPVEIIADAGIVNKLVDATIFVIRTGVLERSMLPEIEHFYQTKKYVNMNLLLNGTPSGEGRYGYHKYGYRYGYKYGYGKGYGKGYGSYYGSSSK